VPAMEDRLTTEEQELVRKVVWQLEMSPTGRCLECGHCRLFHLMKPLRCLAVCGMLRARLGL
jgi:ribosomal protein L32